MTDTATLPAPAASVAGLWSAAPAPPTAAGPVRRYVRDTSLLIGRSLRMMPRVPERLADVTVQPVMFTVLFLYVFGSAISIPGMRYQDYLLPGLLAQSLAFGVIGAGVATATDFSTGVVDRFRSLPISRLAVISAQVFGQMLEQIIGLSIVVGLGLALGWRPDLDVGSTFLLIGPDAARPCSRSPGSACSSACASRRRTRCRASASP